MEAVALTLGVVPYLSGRTILAFGVLLAWFAAQGVFAQREVSVRSVLTGIAVGLGSFAVQLLVQKVKEQLESLVEPAREFLRRLEPLLVALLAMAMLTYLLKEAGARAPTAAKGDVLRAGVATDGILVLGVGGFAYLFARTRATLSELFDLIPLSDERSVRRVLFLSESAWTVGGVLLALLLPVLGAVVGLLLLGALFGLRAVLRRVTRGACAPCSACQAEVHLAASTCCRCGAAHAPRALGLFGRVLSVAPADLAGHRLSLLAARRCGSCAERIETRDGRRVCGGCGQPPFRDPDEARAFLRQVDARTAALAPVFAGVGLVPVLGLGLALVLYKLSPAGALSGYVHWTERFWTRVLRALAFAGLALLQPIPIIGAAASLGIVTLSHLWLRRGFLATYAPSPALVPDRG